MMPLSLFVADFKCRRFDIFTSLFFHLFRAPGAAAQLQRGQPDLHLHAGRLHGRLRRRAHAGVYPGDAERQHDAGRSEHHHQRSCIQH